jgi:hypothetical protein
MSCGRDISPPEAIQTIKDETIRTDLEDGDIQREQGRQCGQEKR